MDDITPEQEPIGAFTDDIKVNIDSNGWAGYTMLNHGISSDVEFKHLDEGTFFILASVRRLMIRSLTDSSPWQINELTRTLKRAKFLYPDSVLPFAHKSLRWFTYMMYLASDGDLVNIEQVMANKEAIIASARNSTIQARTKYDSDPFIDGEQMEAIIGLMRFCRSLFFENNH